MKYYIIAGEASGDLHGSNLMRALKAQDAQAEFRVWGGDRMMKESGGNLVKHYRNTDFVGFTEVLANLRTILRNIKFCKADVAAYAPDVLILIDYPGFNLRIAKWAKGHISAKIVYYISPQVWAWKASRVHLIKRVVDRMMVILPFEADFYAGYDYAVDFVGHPLLDAIDTYPKSVDFYLQNGLQPARPVVALLPGSRLQEIKSLLPTMLRLIPQLEGAQFVIAGAPSVLRETYERYIRAVDDERARQKRPPLSVKIVYGQTYPLLNHAHAAIVASGTATLETALFGVPQVVCYRGSAISYHIAKRIVRIQYISLVNLIMDRLIVTELIQGQYQLKRLQQALESIMEGAERQRILEAYAELRARLGGGGASVRAAEVVQEVLAQGEEPPTDAPQ